MDVCYVKQGDEHPGQFAKYADTLLSLLNPDIMCQAVPSPFSGGLTA